MLSWDLHVHPGHAAEGRWGDGAAVHHAARRSGVQGFVWKTHAGCSLDAAAALVGPPHVIPSISLNSATSAAALEAALDNGVRWIWGPSRKPDGGLAWELPLPADWAVMRSALDRYDGPLVIATSHLDRAGRSEIAHLCAERSDRLCTVTHSLYLDDDEVIRLARLEAVFEADLYTLTRTVRDWRVPLGARTTLIHESGASIYLTSDAGQAATGDPYEFVAGALERIETELPDLLPELIRHTPSQVVRHLGLPGDASEGQM